MNTKNAMDISEDDVTTLEIDILKILLFDRTTRRNIIWATDDYEYFGESYNSKFPITLSQITGDNTDVVQPRATKNKGKQLSRTKGKAEVFTPSWMCNAQNNLIDTQWFGREDVFNTSDCKTWKSTVEKIEFPDNKAHTWQKYVDAKRLEITCGEAPYLVSRYDSVTGDVIELGERIGLLDRKLRVVNENTVDSDEWYKWAKRAFQSIYGFEYLGDSLLLARENLMYTFIDNYIWKFQEQPAHALLKDIALIISWNIWQMDGLTFTVPFQSIYEQYHQCTLGELENEKPEPCYCKIRDWRSKKTLYYYSLFRREGE